MRLLEARNLTKAYNKRVVVKGVTYEVRPGEIVGLLGPNGAGKTTAFRMTIGMISPNDGSVFFDGLNVTKMPMYMRARKGMGYLSQEPSVFQKLTVEENILAILETLNMNRHERKKRCQELLNELGLSKLAKNKAYTLSGGEKRRLEITRALVTSPSLILLDEPFSGVDPIAVADIQEIVKGLKERGMGILLTDHNVRETLQITDRSYIINEGEILRHGTSSELVNDPVTRQIYLGEKFQMHGLDEQFKNSNKQTAGHGSAPTTVQGAAGSQKAPRKRVIRRIIRRRPPQAKKEQPG